MTTRAEWHKDEKGHWRKVRVSGLILDVLRAYGGFAWAIRRASSEAPIYKGSARNLEQAKMFADEAAVRYDRQDQQDHGHT